MSKTVSKTNFVYEVKKEVVKWRRYLHENPELSFEEFNTSQFVYDTLASFGDLELERPTKTSVVATLKGNKPGKVLGLRADMDALPIEETSDVPFKSKKPGVMHACGHDAHTAILLGAAKILTQRKDEISGEVKFVFQHAEELLPGGAKELVEKGVIDHIDYMVGLHVMSTLESGKIGIVYGPFTSNTDEFELKVIGKGGHSSQPDLSIDPVAISAQIITNLQHIVARNLEPAEKLVISTTMINGGTASNIIPETVSLVGSVRSYSQDVRENAAHLIERIVKGITEAHGADYNFTYHYGYSSVINDQQVTKCVEETVAEKFGENYIEYGEPFMGGEDFSAYLTKAPGCFVAIGAKNEQQGFDYPHHHPKFGIDENSLEDGLRLLINLPNKILSQ
ncbi:amidohydrolase [Salinibacillus kushneri]|uniref:Amidohydrolase n=1 Tax=Salinibacillus kushneri TaxID=237682 RepID=A0A1I0AS66_9BACI|nr:amidohydrolase [Salinibacillus kushneri]SES97243.1 amidohydrolase [Salinibacillus kushneri]